MSVQIFAPAHFRTAHASRGGAASAENASGKTGEVKTTSQRIWDSVKEIFRIGLGTAGEVFTKFESLYCITFFMQTIFDIVNRMPDVPPAAEEFCDWVDSFLNCLDPLFLMRDFKVIASVDKKGRHFFERKASFIGENLSWTASHICDVLTFLGDVDAISFSATAGSILSLASGVFTIAACAFGIWDKARSIISTNAKRIKVENLKSAWEGRTADWNTRDADCDEKIERYTQALAAMGANDLKRPKLIKKQRKWNLIKLCQEPQKVQALCRALAEKNAVKMDKCDSKNARSITSIVLYSCLITLIVLSIITDATGIGNVRAVEILMLTLPLTLAIIYIANLVIFKIKAIPKIPKVDHERVLYLNLPAGV